VFGLIPTVLVGGDITKDIEFCFDPVAVLITALLGECFAEMLFFDFKSPCSKLLDFSREAFKPICPTSALFFYLPKACTFRVF